MKNEVLNKFIEEMLKLLQDAKTFAASELPLLLREIVQYEIASSAVWLLMSGVVLIVIWRFALKVYREDRDGDVFGFACIFTVPLLGVFVVQTLDIVQACFAPRVFLIDYFKGLL